MKLYLPVVSPRYTVKLFLPSRVPQHQSDILPVHAEIMTFCKTREDAVCCPTKFSSQGSQLRWSSCTPLWKSLCSTSGSLKTFQRHRCQQSPPGGKEGKTNTSRSLIVMNWWWGYERPAGLFACKGTLPTYIGWSLNQCAGNGYEMNILHSLQLKDYCLIFISAMFGLFVVAIKMKILLMIF